jgi:hypothetical protein
MGPIAGSGQQPAHKGKAVVAGALAGVIEICCTVSKISCWRYD